MIKRDIPKPPGMAAYKEFVDTHKLVPGRSKVLMQYPEIPMMTCVYTGINELGVRVKSILTGRTYMAWPAFLTALPSKVS